MKHIEIRTVETHGIKVVIKIDYDLGTASLVERNGTGFVGKKYFFCDRGLEYMNGWLNILEAMQVAVKECKKELEKDLGKKTRINEDSIIRFAGKGWEK